MMFSRRRRHEINSTRLQPQWRQLSAAREPPLTLALSPPCGERGLVCGGVETLPHEANAPSVPSPHGGFIAVGRG